MASYKELLQQREQLEKQIAETRQTELSAAVQRVRAMIEEFGLTQEDLFPANSARKVSSAKGTAVAAKYRDPSTGATWTGRGKPPLWIKDKNRHDFLINQ